MTDKQSTRSCGDKAILDVLGGKRPWRRPVWMMRQAGRYLPEYRAVREQAGSFLALCADPELASEVTLQPLRRFDLDAAIIFADILLVPQALGQSLDFREGEGPVLKPITNMKDFKALDETQAMSHLKPVFQALERVAGNLAREVTLIGFCGAPWTVASYMIAGGGTPDQRPAREAAYRADPWFIELMELLVRASADYLVEQVRAGAEVLQIFDTWAGVLSGPQYERWCIQPTRDIVRAVKRHCPDTPIIGFPRGSGLRYARFVKETGIDAVSIDWTVPVNFARRQLQSLVPVQGNLDPVALASGGEALSAETETVLRGLDRDRHIFNLGHGILPETPIAHVESLITSIRLQDRDGEP